MNYLRHRFRWSKCLNGWIFQIGQICYRNQMGNLGNRRLEWSRWFRKVRWYIIYMGQIEQKVQVEESNWSDVSGGKMREIDQIISLRSKGKKILTSQSPFLSFSPTSGKSSSTWRSSWIQWICRELLLQVECDTRAGQSTVPCSTTSIRSTEYSAAAMVTLLQT